MSNIAVIIATKNRPESFGKALSSVLTQTVLPEIILVVSDCDDTNYLLTENIVREAGESVDIRLLKNLRTSNLSGAINTGLAYLISKNFTPEDCFVTILDDDDFWEDNYLNECIAIAERDNSDWVVSGLIRHEQKGDDGILLRIPKTLSVDDFYIGNPHIQGSNLFVRLSRLLNAGGYDEALDSTTDRDICIRLLELPGIRSSILGRHMVHHYALSDLCRLSTPGSQKKIGGLTAFYNKYGPRMNSVQREAFKVRAREMFNCVIESVEPPKPVIPVVDSVPLSNRPILVGFIATRINSTRTLIDDLSKLDSGTGLIRVLITDNTESSEQLCSLAEDTKYASLMPIVMTAEKIARNSDAGLYGTHLACEEGRKGIASGRTVLHHHLHSMARGIPGCVVWVLDDDVRLHYLDALGTEYSVDMPQLQSAISGLIDEGVGIGIGRVSNDPPLPVLSMIRTQLLDLHYNIVRFERGVISTKNLARLNVVHMDQNGDYYYDYSESRFTHLETPFWYGFSRERMIQEIGGIEYGRAVFRPIRINGGDTGKLAIVRGGNTIVTDIECLRNFPNTSPVMSGVPFRRGDTLWTVLSRQIGGTIIREFPVPVSQVRTEENHKRLCLDTLLSDFYGSAFVKALDEFYSWKKETGDTLSSRLRLELSDSDIVWIIERFGEHLDRRLTAFVMSWYRISGLIEILDDSLYPEVKSLVHKVLAVLNAKNVECFLLAARTGDRSDITSFLRNFKEDIKSYREHLPQEITPLILEHSISRTKEITGKDGLTYLAHGMEGVVLTDGSDAYKYFHKGVLTFRPGQLDFIRESMLGKNFRHFVNLRDVYQESGEVVFRMELFDGDAYSGEHLSNIRSFLRECKKNNLAYRNMHPKNILVCGDDLKVCDLGRSNVPFTEEEFKETAKRSYLTYRYHFREDLPELMSIALFTEDVPELYGFDYFRNSLEDKAKYELVDSIVINIVKKSGGKEVLDYGCGRGGIAGSLSNIGFSVTGFDIDDEVIRKNVARDTGITYLGSSDLDPLLSSGKQFDVVVCSLVVCTITDETEVYAVLENLRRLVKNEGKVVFAICNPFNTFIRETGTRRTHLKKSVGYSDKFSYDKISKETGRTLFEVHRPFHTIKRMIEWAGFVVSNVYESEGVDFDLLAPASDFLVLELEPVGLPLKHNTSLLIKVSPIEWRTIDFQIEHIISQLDSPRRFSEVIVVTDLHKGPFLRQYGEPDVNRLKEKLEKLKESGVIDRVIYAPDNLDAINQTYLKWFGVESSETHAVNGQHTFTSLYGIEQCQGDYILQMDSDCIVVRLDSSHDYLEDMIGVFNQDPNALTVSFNIAGRGFSPYSHSDGFKSWRTEVRFSLFDRLRLEDALPLPNKKDGEGVLEFPWHRSIDQLIRDSRWKSYRGGDHRTFFIHVQNNVKRDTNRWYNIVKEAERGYIPPVQFGSVDLRGSTSDWLETRNEKFVYILRGMDVAIPKIRRVLDSIDAQTCSEWGMVIIDAGSSNGSEEYFEHFVVPKYRERVTFWRNRTPITPIENTKMAIKELCSNPDSIIINLDTDDALIGSNVLDRLKSLYDRGVDLTVGSMLRTDKYMDYPVDFNTPRKSRGGNVWQHLTTFKKPLFDSIPEDYFKIYGEWVPPTEDWAVMLPMVDIAEKPVYIKDYLYFYEPSEDKSIRSIMEREALIAEIIDKPKMVVTN